MTAKDLKRAAANYQAAKKRQSARRFDKKSEEHFVTIAGYDMFCVEEAGFNSFTLREYAEWLIAAVGDRRLMRRIKRDRKEHYSAT